MKYIVQEYVAGKWYDVREYNDPVEAELYAARFIVGRVKKMP